MTTLSFGFMGAARKLPVAKDRNGSNPVYY